MTLNSPNPQRGTGVRKAATGVNPAVPAQAARPATGRVPAVAPPAAPAAAPGTGRAMAARRPGGPAPGGAGKAPLRSAAAAKQGGGKGTKYLMLTIIVLLLAMVGYCFIPMGGKAPLAIRLARMYGLIKKDTGAAAPEEAAAVGLDAKYSAALKIRGEALEYQGGMEAQFKDTPDKLTEVEIKHVLEKLESYRAEVYLGVDDITRVIAANGKDTAVPSAMAKEELPKQKEAAMTLGKALQKWKGPKDQIFAKSDEFVTQKFSPAPAPAPDKPAEKRDPKSLLTVVAPATPNDIPKPPDPPKEDPKPAEPKPEPEKPKEDPKPEPKPEPVKPKPAEPEKPKPAEPKPEPEKPKEDPKPEPKPEPEKPKPAEPKPEPEKPKEEPKPEPKPEPEKPKEDPKPEPKAEKKVDVIVADADKLVVEGSPMAKEVIVAARNLPTDPEKLKTLSMKAETAQAFFVKAKDSYIGVKDAAPESADIATKLGKIEKILALLQSAADAINSKRK